MATIEKRETSDGKTSYRAKVRVKGFPVESATFERLTDAREWAKRIEVDMKAGRYFGGGKRKPLGDLFDKYEAVAAPRLKSWDGVKRRLDWWREKAGGELLEAITPTRIAAWRDELLALPKRNGGGQRSGADVNRALAALSAAMKYGINELEWLEKNPVKRVTKQKEASGRIRYLTDEELPRLLTAVRASPHPDLLPALLLSLTTGARSSEIMGLRWSQIDFKRRSIALANGETKNDVGRALPLSGEIAELLQTRNKVRNLKDDRVFPPLAGCKVLELRDPWKAALVAANIDVRPANYKGRKDSLMTSDFRWHDLRHTAASYLTMSGIGVIEVARVLGHKTLAMTLRYTHLAPDRVTELGDTLAARLGVAGGAK
jgi:integrase